MPVCVFLPCSFSARKTRKQTKTQSFLFFLFALIASSALFESFALFLHTVHVLYMVNLGQTVAKVVACTCTHNTLGIVTVHEYKIEYMSKRQKCLSTVLCYVMCALFCFPPSFFAAGSMVDPINVLYRGFLLPLPLHASIILRWVNIVYSLFSILFVSLTLSRGGGWGTLSLSWHHRSFLFFRNQQRGKKNHLPIWPCFGGTYTTPWYYLPCSCYLRKQAQFFAFTDLSSLFWSFSYPRPLSFHPCVSGANYFILLRSPAYHLPTSMSMCWWARLCLDGHHRAKMIHFAETTPMRCKESEPHTHND